MCIIQTLHVESIKMLKLQDGISDRQNYCNNTQRLSR